MIKYEPFALSTLVTLGARPRRLLRRGLAFLILGPTLCLQNCSEPDGSANTTTQRLMRPNTLSHLQETALPFATHHVQGLEITPKHYFVTAVDKKERRGWLFKGDRESGNLLVRRELTEDKMIHPGGLQYDGRFLWVPNAEYDREGSSKVLSIDPDSLEIRAEFEVDDHIGAVASDGKGRIFGANWDARQFYVWDQTGKQLEVVDSPTQLRYQDMKYVEGNLLCSGSHGDTSAVDIIDPGSWQLVKRIGLPTYGPTDNLAREGMAFDGRFHFLPEDGPNSRILTFDLK